MHNASTSKHVLAVARVRPALPHERAQASCIQVLDEESLEVVDREGRSQRFKLDAVVDPRTGHASQSDVYDVLCRKFLGINFGKEPYSLLAYGQAGSGKTTSLFGHDFVKERIGVAPRFARDLVENVAPRLPDATCYMRLLEIQHDNYIRDLLGPLRGGHSSIELNQHPTLGVHVAGATEVAVTQASEVAKFLAYAAALRTASAPTRYARSSRSHVILTLRLHWESTKGMHRIEFNFVDLAGHEGPALEMDHEEVSINRGLFHLSMCLRALRDSNSSPSSSTKLRSMAGGSKLTTLLGNALCGHSRFAVLGTLSPIQSSATENLATLQFLQQTRSILTTSQGAQSTVFDRRDVIDSLVTEIGQLQRHLSMTTEKDKAPHAQRQLVTAQSLRNSLEQAGIGKSHAASIRSSREQELADLGLNGWSNPSKTSDSGVFLANVCADDPSLTAALVYWIPSNMEVSIGNSRDDDFVVSGIGTTPNMCSLYLERSGRLVLRYPGLTGVLVNGLPLPATSSSLELKSEDKLTLGQARVFMVCVRPDGPAPRLGEVLEDEIAMTSMSLTDLVSAAIGSRREDPEELAQAKEYCAELCENYDLSDEALRSFLIKVVQLRERVDEANAIMAALHPTSELSFDLHAWAPVLSLGFPLAGHLPAPCVSMTKTSSSSAMDGVVWPVDEFLSRLATMHREYELLKNGWCNASEILKDSELWSTDGPKQMIAARIRRQASELEAALEEEVERLEAQLSEVRKLDGRRPQNDEDLGGLDEDELNDEIEKLEAEIQEAADEEDRLNAEKQRLEAEVITRRSTVRETSNHIQPGNVGNSVHGAIQMLTTSSDVALHTRSIYSHIDRCIELSQDNDAQLQEILSRNAAKTKRP